MAWPSDMSSFGSLAACRCHFGMDDALWAAYIASSGDPGGDYRLLAALPPTVVATIAEHATLMDGSQVTPVEAAQFCLVCRFARWKRHADRGLDMIHGTQCPRHLRGLNSNFERHHPNRKMIVIADLDSVQRFPQ